MVQTWATSSFNWGCRIQRPLFFLTTTLGPLQLAFSHLTSIIQSMSTVGAVGLQPAHASYLTTSKISEVVEPVNYFNIQNFQSRRTKSEAIQIHSLLTKSTRVESTTSVEYRTCYHSPNSDNSTPKLGAVNG